MWSLSLKAPYYPVVTLLVMCDDKMPTERDEVRWIGIVTER